MGRTFWCAFSYSVHIWHFLHTEWGKNMDYEAKEASCIPQVTLREPRLTGQGVLIAVLDSGIDYFLTEFRNSDGTTRILALWDQTAVPNAERGWLPPEGYTEGVVYTRENLNAALAAGSRQEGLAIVPQQDVSGHGTAVAALAAGSQSGVAVQAQLVIVKLGNPLAESFPRTTQLMRGISYAVNLGVELNMPVVINLSFGNTYGDHRGESLLERFIDNASEIGRTSIIIGSGNEGASNGHTAGIALTQKTIELAVATYETGLSIQIWKHSNDDFELRLRSPGGEEVQLETRRVDTLRRTLEQTQLLCYIGEPLPYSVNQEIYIDMFPTGRYINEGVWSIVLTPRKVVTGEYRMYLPSYAARNTGTGFFLPTPEVTLTIPSTSLRAVTVGAYDIRTSGYADFSGRGYVYRYEEGRVGEEVLPFGTAFSKPDIVAPGVNITVPVPGGSTQQVSGTSFATPIVSGSAALLMEYGIVRGNDPYLYGQKLKAYLINGAKKLPGYERFPNDMTGWGALCVADSLP